MSKAKKLWLIIGAVLASVGLFIFIGVMAALNFDFSKLSMAQYETNVYETEGNFSKILIDVKTTDIVFLPSDNEKCRVVCYEQEKLKHSVRVKDGALMIDTADTRKWYEHIGVFFGGMKMTVYLPKKEYASLVVASNTGDVDIPDNFIFENIEITGHTGDVTCHGSALNTIKIKMSTGDITTGTLLAEDINLSTSTGDINIGSVTAKGSIKAETNTGKVRLTDVTCMNFSAESSTGDILLRNVAASESFSIRSSTGDVEFENSDASQIFVKTSTGDVTGSLLTEKIFITETSTGDISVPKSTTGGKCEIKTSTGDIEIYVR